MANILIKETDLTTAGSSSVTDNVVYVPGYAIMGPTNEPTLCSTLSEFQKIFGNAPYKFKSSQSIGIQGSQETYAQQGEYEKSYLYAAEILKAGLPVLFERVTTSDVHAESTIYLIKKKFSYNETQQTVYNLHINSIEGVLDEVDNTVYHYSYNLPLGYETKEIVSLVNDDLNIDISDIIINEEGTTISFDANIDKLNNISLTYHLKNAITWLFEGSFDESKDKVVFNVTKNNTPLGNAIVLYDGEHLSYTTEIGYTIKVSKKDFSIIDDTEKAYYDETNNVIKLKAKYPGEYGKNIYYQCTPIYGDDNELYYKFIINFKNGDKEIVEDAHIISLNQDKNNFIKYESSDYITFEETRLNQNIILCGLYELKIEGSQLIYNIDETQIKDEFNINDFYDQLSGYSEIISSEAIYHESIFNKLSNRDEYNVKFITSGSYPVIDIPNTNSTSSNTSLSIITNMLVTAGNRGDAIALLDHSDEAVDLMFTNLKTTLTPRIVSDTTGEDAKKYGAIFTPWGKYQLQTINEITSFPASFAYLKCLAASTKTNANWYAISGVTRGQVPNLLGLNQKLSGALADQLQSREGISINPITNIRPYGYCIWGNRTLYKNVDDLTASSFLNIRMLTNDVKKVVYSAAKKLTFELNSDILWLNFKSQIEPTLEEMRTGNGLSNYKIIKLASTKKSTITCKIRLYAIEAVEDWDITVELADSYTSIE